MKKLNINYNITKYEYDPDYKVTKIKNQTATYKVDTLFPKMIEEIVIKNKIKYFQIHVEDLKNNTWGKIFNEEILFCMNGDDNHYRWLNYKIGDIQEKFKLFDKPINIIIDGLGVGGGIDEEEGIKFIINNNEKDRHEFEPHVHCKYAGEEMRIRIDTLEVMKKDKEFKNKKKVKFAKEWIRLHQDSLLKYYNEFAIKGNSNIKFEAYL